MSAYHGSRGDETLCLIRCAAMGKGPVVSKLPKDGGKEISWHAALVSILTANEYRIAVTALVNGVEDVLKGNGEMEDFRSALRRLLRSRYDPPLPLYWTFVAVEKSLWLDSKSDDPLEVGMRTLDFVSRVSSSLNSLCVGNSSGRTGLSARAPIVGLLYEVASVLHTTVGSLDEIQTDAKTADGTGKKVRKLARKLKESLKQVLGYTVLCYRKDSKTFERPVSGRAAPIVPLENLPEILYPEFPLASRKIKKSLKRDSSSTEILAETVFVEVVLLQLVVEIIHRRILLKKQNANSIVGQDEFVTNLKLLAVHSVRAANSTSPSEMVMDLLLLKRLPVRDLLDAKEEILVRGVLFEAVLVDDIQLFSLFDEANGELKSYKSGLDHMSVVFMKKLSVARHAVAFFRSQEERFRLTALLRDMTTWHFPPQLWKWLSQKTHGLPVVALQSREFLTHWLVNVAEISVFAGILDECVATWPSGLTSVAAAKPVEVAEMEDGDAHSEGAGEDLFFVDTAGETEAAIDSETAADLNFTAAAKKMKGEGDKIMTKKKKKKKNKEKKKQSAVLFHRHEQSSSGTKRSRMEIDDVHLTSRSGSDSDDSEENVSKSAKKKVKKSKRKVVNVLGATEEDEDDDNDGALASTHLASREENSPPVKFGDVSNQQQEEVLQRIQSPKDQTVEKSQALGSIRKGGAAEEDAEEITIVDMQIASTVSQADPVLLSVGKSAKKKKKKSKDPEDPGFLEPADAVGRRKDGSQSIGRATKQLVNRSPEPSIEGEGDGCTEEDIVVNKAIQPLEIGADGPGEAAKDLAQTVTNEICQEPPSSPPVSLVELVPLSVGKSAKKKKNKSKDAEDPDLRELAETVGRSRDGPVFNGTPNTKLVHGDLEANAGGKGDADAEENSAVNTGILSLETRADVQEPAAKDLAQTVTATNSELSPSSLLTPRDEGNDLGETVRVTAVLPSESPRNAQEDVRIVESSKKKRKNKSLPYGAEVDDLQIFDTIKKELVVGSANVSCADLIQALQAGKSLSADPQASGRKGRTPSKRARLGDEGNNVGDIRGILTREGALLGSVVSSDKTSSVNVTAQDRKAFRGDMTLVEEEASLSATLMEEILGSRQTEVASGRMHAGFEQTMSTPVGAKSTLQVDGVVLGLPSPVGTEAYLPVDGVVLGEDDGAQNTTRPVVESIETPIKNVGEQTRLQSQGTPTSDMAGTSARSEAKKKRDLTGTPTSRKKRSKGQTDAGLPSVVEEMIQIKEEDCEEAPLAIPEQMLDGGNGQYDRKVRTVDAVDHVLDTELLLSVPPPSRRRKTELGTPKSVGSDTTDEIFYQRRTRSGRALGTPTPTPPRKANARRELVLEPSQEK